MSEPIKVAHRGFSVTLPESRYFDATPHSDAWGDDKPAGRKVQVQSLLFDVGVGSEYRILAYGTWYLLNGKFTSTYWGGGAAIHWADIPMAIRSDIRSHVRQMGGMRKWWRA